MFVQSSLIFFLDFWNKKENQSNTKQAQNNPRKNLKKTIIWYLAMLHVQLRHPWKNHLDMHPWDGCASNISNMYQTMGL